MFFKIIKFEVLSRFKRPMSALLVLLMAFQAIWFTQGSFEHYANESTLMNGSALFYRNFAGGGLIMTMIIAIITGTVLFKDIQFKSASLLYTTPIHEKKFFLGRFMAAYLINIVMSAGLILGMALVPFSGIAGPDQLGPTPWIQIMHGFFVLTVPNLFVMTAVCFAALVFFKKMTAGYLSIFAVMLIFMVCESIRSNFPNVNLLMLIDPSTFIYTTITLDKVSATSKSTAFLQLTELFFINRTIWVGGSAILLLLALRKFSFKYFVDIDNKRKKSKRSAIDESQAAYDLPVPVVNLNFSQFDLIKKIGRLSFLEFRNVVRPSNFKVILGLLCVMFLVQSMFTNASFYIGEHHPLTSTMTLTRVAQGVFLMFLLMIWTGELLFKDKTLNIWQLNDIAPVPTWVTHSSKFIAMCGVALLMAITMIACGMLTQIILGAPYEIDLALYAEDMLIHKWGWFTYILNIAFVFFVAGITGNRFATHIFSVGYYIFNLVSIEYEIIHQIRFTYSVVPGVEDFSEMNGYGIWNIASFWFFIMWSTMAVVFVLLGIHFWRRGTEINLWRKFSFKGGQLNPYGKVVVALCLVAFLSLQSFIIRKVNVPGNYESEESLNRKDSEYETTYKKIQSLPHPKITGIDLQLDLFPDNRQAIYSASMKLTNFNSESVDTLYLNSTKFASVQTVEWNGKSLSPHWHDERLAISAYVLNLSPSDSGILAVTGDRKYIGFTQIGETPQPELMYNGSFLHARDLLPIIGYNYDRTLKTNRDRRSLGIEMLVSRMPPVTDTAALAQDAFAFDSEWLRGTISISTSEDQTAVAPGKKIRHWKEAGRNHYVYEIEAKSPYEWFFASAEYAETNMALSEKVSASIMFKNSHHYNLNLYKRALQSSFQFVESNLGPYPFSEVRLLEIPFYQQKLYSFPNTIAISEKEGWFADTTALEERSYVFFTAASQLISHWTKQNIKLSNVQGANMIKVALPEAMALILIEKYFGKKGVDLLLEKKKKAYIKDRGNEPNLEPALLYADGIDYLESNKGTSALFELSQKLGGDRFIERVREWSIQNNDKNTHFLSLYQFLIQDLDPESLAQIKTTFEKVS